MRRILENISLYFSAVFNPALLVKTLRKIIEAHENFEHVCGSGANLEALISDHKIKSENRKKEQG